MQTTTQTTEQRSPWIELERHNAILRQGRATEALQEFFKGTVSIEALHGSLKHLERTNGKELDSRFLPLELRDAIVDGAASAAYLEQESLFFNQIDAFRSSRGRRSSLTDAQQDRLRLLTPEFQAWCSLPENEKEVRHNSAEAALLKLMLLGSHLQDDGSLYRGSLGIDHFAEHASRLTLASQVQNWLRLDAHDGVTAAHTALLETLDGLAPAMIEDPKRLPLDVKLSAVDLCCSLKDVQRSFRAMAHPWDLGGVRECIRKAEQSAEKYLLAEQAA